MKYESNCCSLSPECWGTDLYLRLPEERSVLSPCTSQGDIKMSTSPCNVAFIAAPNFTLMTQNAKLILVYVKSKALFVTLAITFILNLVIIGGTGGAAHS